MFCFLLLIQFPSPFCCCCAGSISRPEISEEETRQIEVAYAAPDRTWPAISKGRRVCAMGKYNMQDDRERLKAIARKKKENKEKALKKDKPQELNLKRKGTEGDQVRKSASVKKPRASNEGDEVDPAQGLTTAIVESGAEQDRSKEIVSEPRKMTKSSSASLKLKPFLDDVVQAFSRSTAGKSSSPQTDSEKFLLAFNQSAMVSFCL